MLKNSRTPCERSQHVNRRKRQAFLSLVLKNVCKDGAKAHMSAWSTRIRRFHTSYCLGLNTIPFNEALNCSDFV